MAANVFSTRHFDDNVKLQFGEHTNGAADFTIFHNAPSSVSTANIISAIENAGGSGPTPKPIKLKANEVNIIGQNDNIADFIETGSGNSQVKLYANNAVKFETTSTGASVTGDLTISSISNAGSDTDKFLVSNGGKVAFRTGAEVRSDIGAGTGNGTMSSWDLTADSGGTETITNGESVDIAGGTNITTTRSSSTITIDNDLTNNNQLTNGAGYTTNVGTVTSVAISGGTGVTVSGSPITSSGTITITADNNGTVTSVATSSPLTGGTITGSGTIGITQADATTSGYLSSTDWSTFNGKGSMSSWSLTADSGGTATVTNGETVDIAGGTNISTSRSGETITITNGITNNNQLTNGAGYTTNTGTVTSVATGSGLTGGTITTSGTLSVDSTVIRTTGTQSKSGDLTLTSDLILNGEFNMENGSDILMSATGNIQIDGDSGTGKFLKSVATGMEWTSITQNAGTVTSVAVSAGTGISVSGSPITSSGTITISATNNGTVTSVSVDNPATTAASNQPLQLTGSGTVNPTISFHRLAVANLPNLVETETSTAVGGGVTQGTWNANTQLDITDNTDGSYQGEIVYFGTVTGSLTAGKLYIFTTTDGEWQGAQANSAGKTSGLLAIALGTSVSDGLLTRGIYTLSYTSTGATTGSVLYISSSSAGNVTHEPPSGTGNFVRIIGTQLDATNGQIFFHPDNTFIELS